MFTKFFESPAFNAISQRIFLLGLLAALSPYIYLSFFAHPIADDYCAATMYTAENYLGKCLQEYFNWNGIYSYNFLFFLSPTNFHNLDLYKAAPIAMITLLILSTYYFFRSVTERSFTPLQSLNVSLLIVLLFLFQMPSLAEGVYWYAGVIAYETGIIFSLFYFGLVCDYFNGKYFLSKYFHFLLTSTCLIVAVGFSEVTMLLLISFHVFISGILFKNKIRLNAEWKVLLMVCFLSSCVVVLAPGNLQRNNMFPDNHNLMRSFSYTLMQIARFGFDWVSALPILLSSILLIPFVVKYADKISFVQKLRFVTPMMILVGLFWILFVCIFPPYFITNILGQHRTVNVAYFFFILVWFLGVILLVNTYAEKAKHFLINNKLSFISMLLILLSILSTKNGYAVFIDIFYGKAHRFNIEMNNRYAVLENPNNKGKVIYFEPLMEKPKSLFLLDLTSDSTNWINYNQALYFGVKDIVCKESAEK